MLIYVRRTLCANLEREESGRSRTPLPPEKSFFLNLHIVKLPKMCLGPRGNLWYPTTLSPWIFFNPRKDIPFVAKSSTWRLVIARYDWLTWIYLNIEFWISTDPPGRDFFTNDLNTHVHQVLVYIWRIIELELSCSHVWLMSH